MNKKEINQDDDIILRMMEINRENTSLLIELYMDLKKDLKTKDPKASIKLKVVK